MPNPGTEFKQFSYFIDNLYEPKKKNRFMLHIPKVPQLTLDGANNKAGDGTAQTESGLLLALMTANRPQYTVESSTIDRYNEQAFWAAKPSHSKEMSCTFNDYIDGGGLLSETASTNAAIVLYRWFNVVYNLSLGSMGYKKDYATDAELYLLDPQGKVVEQWHYQHLYPQDLNYETLEMTSTDVCTISAVFKYDKVKLITAYGPTAKYSAGYSSQFYESASEQEESGGEGESLE